MLLVHNNMVAWNAGRQLKINSKKIGKSTEKLSSGYKINRSADDVAGLAMSEKMRWMIRGLNQGTENTMDGVSWLQIGDGAMSEINDMVHRITELSVKGANDTLTDDERLMIDAEVKQLKKQINMIGRNTSFNEIPIFDNSNLCLNVYGAADDLQVFNSTYDDATGDVVFGGVIFFGERITWDKIDPDMVTVDPNTGKDVFKEGTYTITTQSGRTLQILCEEGAEVPDFRVKKIISTDPNGIIIDNELFPWEQLLDEDGNPCTPDNVHGGGWGVNYHGAIFSFYVPDEISNYVELSEALLEANNEKAPYVWETYYVGNEPTQAVDVTTVNQIRISNALATEMAKSDQYSITVRADNNGIRLEDGSGNTLAGSDKSWTDLGIGSWNAGSDISEEITYEYYTDTRDDPYFSFDFTLSDITSVDSVVDGLDGMVVSQKSIATNYVPNVSIDTNKNKNILSLSSSTNPNMVSFDREVALGRDFDTKEIEGVSESNVDIVNNVPVINFQGNGGNDVITLTGTASLQGVESRLANNLRQYMDYAAKQKLAYLMDGKNPDDAFKASVDLKDIVGAGNITVAGYFNETVTLDPSMNKSDGSSGFRPGQDGSTYPTAFIDFKNITQLSVLEKSGFDSTCKTCNNHYSVIFDYNVSAEGNTQTSASGYEYSMNRDGADYFLKIDIGSLANSGVADGEDLANALVEITSECFDFHYTQYAAEGSKLYVYDNRESSAGAPSASFYTKPYSAASQDTFTINTRSPQNDYINLQYTYDYADAADRVSVGMQVDNSMGSYVKIKNADGTEGYKLEKDFDPTVDIAVGADRYSVTVSYKDSDGNDVTEAEARQDYAQKAIKSMLDATTISLDARDHTYMSVKGDEKPNVAIKAVFESSVREIPQDNGIKIKHSSLTDDFTTIPRFAMNTVVTGVYGAGAKTQEQAEQTIGMTKNALRYIAEKRALYGAYQNRLEHTYQNNLNKVENTTAAESRIRDTDMSGEMVEYSNNMIIQQAASSMLSQANQQPSTVLYLLNQ